MNKVENLKKVFLKIEAGTTAECMDLTPTALEYEFIFGISPAGMCRFEYELIQKTEGDIVILRLNREEIHHFSGHLLLPVLNLFEEYESLFLKVKIIKISPADTKEVIKALAESTSHSDGCGCGCGC